MASMDDSSSIGGSLGGEIFDVLDEDKILDSNSNPDIEIQVAPNKKKKKPDETSLYMVNKTEKSCFWAVVTSGAFLSFICSSIAMIIGSLIVVYTMYKTPGMFFLYGIFRIRNIS
ncbi:unnamed protein product [Adineta steineri]|uniref:Uncharacterized protein n=1 Tax=Adineta steineri TaxID=433720 RepID=A0A814E7U8_9BILA|nr:unnamed protein product [Adineta steineri]